MTSLQIEPTMTKPSLLQDGLFALVLTSYNRAYPNPIRLSIGVKLRIEKWETDPDWLGWVFCRTEDDQTGWVPQTSLKIFGQQAESIACYDASELTVLEGEYLTVHRSESGWTWAENQLGELGWVPSKILNFLNHKPLI